MLSAWDRRDRPREEVAAAGLQGFAVDKNFLSSLKGILLETELVLTFIIFICFTASISAYMAAALLEFFITLAFLFLYATQYYQRFDRLNWPCLDFLRCVSAIIIFLVVSFAAVTSREGAAIAAFVSPAPQSSPAPQGPLAGGGTLSVPLSAPSSSQCRGSSSHIAPYHPLPVPSI
ncbi:CKLF-like MARVEL transmembrane domain-containing protein 5 isoform X1 [Phacochoerus africanus]|uniref:CKLF-like MARVEL transmembrane domain-containing protein 5 isoform X1 n=1 Tax=Phacochoerus africanus TaxID=41426 RepID=UPI001FDA4C5D|nr:CKLF-like MARVEL transmembrane domain-containing protein 5 isoform X1 [Phacochoerus africanus]